MATSIDTSSDRKFAVVFNTLTLIAMSISVGIVKTQSTSEGNVAEPKNQIPEINVDDVITEDRFNDKNFYSFTVMDHDGHPVPLDKYRNKVTLVVNVASKCGYTDGHYKALIRMKNILSIDNKFEVLAFPCNQFGAQEPGSNADIQKFVRDMYHVNFPVFGKINVVDENVPEAFQYLVASTGETPTWNFWKYLVNEKGHVVKAWGPWVSVEDIFHEVKEVVDNIGFEQPSYKTRHSRSEGEL